MKTIGALLVTTLLVAIGVLLGMAVILAWSLGIGWLLMQFLPLAWFEAALLAMLASGATAYVGWRVLQMPLPETTELDNGFTLFESAIPVGRFKADESDRREEVWFRHEIANDLYWEFKDTPSIEDSMSETEMKELAIRLTDVVVKMLKQRTSRAQQVRITKTQLKRQLNKMELRPYDDDILLAVVDSVNMSLSSDEELADIVRDKSWDEVDPDWQEGVF